MKSLSSILRSLPHADYNSRYYPWLVLGTTMIATFMAVLDATIVTVALPNLMAAFGVPIDTIEWMLTAYLLVFGVMLPSSGWFADRFGYKKIFMLGLVLFTAGSFLCSIAWDIGFLMFFRIVQGLGAGVLMPVGMAIVTREFPPQKRGIALGFWSVSASASVALGPTVGGFLIDKYSWHSIFDINVPIGIVGFILSQMILKEYRSKDVGRFDFVGFISLIFFLSGLLLGLSNGNASWNTGGWTSRFILSSFSISFLGFIVFIFNELITKRPLIEISLFKNYNFSLTNIVLFSFGVGLFGSNFLMPLYLQNALGYTPFQTGLVFLPLGIALGLTGPVAGLIADKVSAKYPPLIGLILLAYTFYQYSFLSLFSEKHQVVDPLYIRGIGMGLMFSPLTTLALSEIPNNKIAQASGLINVIRQIGGSFGVALFGAVLSNRTELHMSQYGTGLQQHAEVLNMTQTNLSYYTTSFSGGLASEALQKSQAMIAQYTQQQAFVSSINDVFLIAAVILIASLVPGLMLHEHKKRESQDTARAM